MTVPALRLMTGFFLALALASSSAGAAPGTSSGPPVPADVAGAEPPGPVRLRTSDGWTLTALYRRSGPNAVILLHGLAAGKGEWASLQEELAARGVSTLAVDLRGHGGGSYRGKPRSYETFLDRGPRGEWAGMWRDAEAALEFLRARGHKSVGAAGASLGANAAFAAAGRLKGLAFVALLSPGSDYQGVRLRDSEAAYGRRRLLLAASRPDAYAYQSALGLKARRLAAGLPAEWLEAASGHGAQMLAEPAALRRAAEWLAASR